MDSLFSIPAAFSASAKDELFEKIALGDNGLVVERIISNGHTTPEGQWYDQERDEWVLVLEGEAVIAFEGGAERRLRKGNHLLLPKHVKHRVAYTSSPCIWLAVFADRLE